MGVFTDRSALLIIDMIHDFVHPEGALAVPDANSIVPRIAALMGEAHETGVPVVHVTDGHDPDDREFVNWPPHAVRGTRGAEIVEVLKPGGDDIHLEKKRFSAFFETDLDEVLKRRGVDHVVITGTVTNICVLATALDALMRGYSVTVPESGVIGLDERDHRFTIDMIERVFGVEVVE